MLICFTARAKVQVGFSASSIRNYRNPQSHKPLIFRDIQSNVGNGYNNHDGYFYVPHDGLYFFAANLASLNGRKYVRYYLFVDNIPRAGGYSDSNHLDANTVHTVLHLYRGRRVWVNPLNHKNFYPHAYCYFSGFLVTPDF